MNKEDIVAVIGDLKMAAQNAINKRAYELEKDGFYMKDNAMRLAAEFIEDILLLPAAKYVKDDSDGHNSTCVGIDFHKLFGDKADELMSVFQICQLRVMNPVFDNFMEENPEYDQYHQSTDTED